MYFCIFLCLYFDSDILIASSAHLSGDSFKDNDLNKGETLLSNGKVSAVKQGVPAAWASIATIPNPSKT